MFQAVEGMAYLASRVTPVTRGLWEVYDALKTGEEIKKAETKEEKTRIAADALGPLASPTSGGGGGRGWFDFVRPKREKIRQHSYMTSDRGDRLVKETSKPPQGPNASLLSQKYADPSSFSDILSRASIEIQAGRITPLNNQGFKVVVDMGSEQTGWVNGQVVHKLMVVFGIGGWHHYPTP